MKIALQRLLIGILFVVMAGLQLRYTVTTVGLLRHPDRYPGLLDIDTLTMAMTPDKDLRAAGVLRGDVLIAQDGEPVHSRVDEALIFFRHRPHETTTLTLRRKGGAPFDVKFTIPETYKSTPTRPLILIMLNVVTPWCCILLGFLVAFRRPGESVMWPLLFFLCAVSQLLRANNGVIFGWQPIFLWPVLFVNGFASRAAIVGWTWFATVFPDPRSKNRVMPWALWVLGFPYGMYGLTIGIWFTVASHDSQALSWLEHVIDIPDWIERSFSIALLVIGFANLAFKLVRETNPSTRRRLKWVAFGLSAGVLPVFGLLTIAAFMNKALDDVPMPILLPCILSPFLIPVTLAYAVLVDRLFDVGVVLRQGLLASRTVSAIRVALMVAVIYMGAGVASDDKMPGPKRILELVACVVAVVAIRRGAAQLRKWVDRRFFQETVNSEHLLVELTGQVRAIRDPEALLRTVTDRIASAMHVSRVAALMPGVAGFAPAYALGYGSDSSSPVFALAFDDPAVVEMRESRRPMTRSDDLLVPMAAGVDLQGILSLGPKRSEEPYSGRDMALLESVASQTALALENSRLTATVAEEAAQRERITNELEIARTVQERLFPKAAPRVPGLELAGLCRPAQTVGGDYYDFFATPSGATGLAIGDIAGKGIPAALLMAGLQASLRGLTLAGISDLADLMGKLNSLMYDASPANRFATFFCCLYEAETGRLCYSSAGHNPALLLRADTGEAVWLKTRGVALGLRKISVYEQAEVVLAPGDCLLLYTDGVTEARNLAGDEFEEARLEAAMRGLPDCGAGERVQGLLASIDKFAAGAVQHDDITVIAAVRL